MGLESKIEWTDHTFNPWWGCTKISPACDNCYAESFSKRLGLNIWSHRNERKLLSESNWRNPLIWNNRAKKSGIKERVFCASMADVFEWKHGLSDLRNKLWEVIEATPFLIWLLLTKRPHLVGRMVPWTAEWPKNVWIGSTVENQKWTDKRIPWLAELPTKNTFLSCEPLLGEIDLNQWLETNAINWVIAGGESGPKARPSDPMWFKSVRDQCIKHRTPFHFKQWGNWAPVDSVIDHIPRQLATVGYSTLVGRFKRQQSGRSLEGQEWNQVPAQFGI